MRTHSPSHVAWSEGRRLLGAVLHSSNEPSELSQWPCGHDDSIINTVMGIQARSYVQARGGNCLLVPRRLNFFETQINVMRNCVKRKTRSSADADNRLDAFSGQSRSTNMVPWYNSNFVFRRAVFTIFVFKKFHDLEMGVKGHWRSLRVVSFDRLCMVSY